MSDPLYRTRRPAPARRFPSRRTWTLTTAALAFTMTSAAAAGGYSPQMPHTWAFQWENDVFGKGRTDRHYTNGLRLTRHDAPRPYAQATGQGASGWLTKAGATRLCRWSACDADGALVAADWQLGQSMYTPQNLSSREPDPFDRPYAGWLYVAHRTRLLDRLDADHEATRQVALDLSLGIVGPSAGAGWVQRHWHRLVDAVTPRGWPFQLRDEPALQATFSVTRRVRLGRLADVLPEFRVAAGTVFAYAGVGTTLRIGRRLHGFATLEPIPSAIPGVHAVPDATTGTPREPKTSSHLFASIAMRAVAHNIFIDGGTLRRPPYEDAIARRPWVNDLSLGAVMNLTPTWQLTYAHTWRSTEFRWVRTPPDGTPPPRMQRYGTIQLRRSF
ncbi:MAG: lipid A deacylase LpxR family protein [Rhodoferax sp.]|nr:lipid A deacylase LpxR family protein [Rhodoferax sp.]